MLPKNSSTSPLLESLTTRPSGKLGNLDLSPTQTLSLINCWSSHCPWATSRTSRWFFLSLAQLLDQRMMQTPDKAHYAALLPVTSDRLWSQIDECEQQSPSQIQGHKRPSSGLCLECLLGPAHCACSLGAPPRDGEVCSPLTAQWAEGAGGSRLGIDWTIERLWGP